MNAAAIRRTTMMDDIPDPSMKGPMIASTIFHLVLFTLTAVGLPFIIKDQDIITSAISVELVDIAEITQTNKPPAPKPVEKEPIVEEKAPPPEEKIEPPKMVEETPPPPELEKPTPPEKKPEVVEKPKPKPEKPKEVKEAKPQKDINTLLKNLTDTKPQNDSPATETLENSNPEESQIANIGDRLTMSEEDAIRAQITPCWNIPAGSKFAEDLAVEIRVFMNRDGSISNTRILDSSRYNRDSHFRAAADAAERALRNPRCTPLKYPPGKYEEMKAFVFRFDPKDML